MFDPAVMTILVQAAGGSGSWRMWHYVVVDDTTMDDLTAPNFFDGMSGDIESGSIVYVTAPTYVAQLAMIRHDGVLTAHPMSVAGFEDAGAPKIQNLPQGSQVGGSQNNGHGGDPESGSLPAIDPV